jgi:hypothetical protein
VDENVISNNIFIQTGHLIVVKTKCLALINVLQKKLYLHCARNYVPVFISCCDQPVTEFRT